MTFRRAALFAGMAALLALTACAGSERQDHPVSIAVENGGPEPLRCEVMFGHWVSRDLGVVEAGKPVQVDVKQAGDGALYVLRADGQRKMMIEALYCGRDGDWMESRGQVDLAPLRSLRARSAIARCALEGNAVRCEMERIESQS